MLRPLTGWLPPKRADGVLALGENVEKPELQTASRFYYAALGKKKIIRRFLFFLLLDRKNIFSFCVFIDVMLVMLACGDLPAVLRSWRSDLSGLKVVWRCESAAVIEAAACLFFLYCSWQA